MRRAGLVLLVAVSVAVSGCWFAPGYDGTRRSFNPYEVTLTPDSIGSLHLLWQQDFGQPTSTVITDAQRLFVSIGEPEQKVVSLDPASGTPLWSHDAPAGVASPVLGDLEIRSGVVTSSRITADGFGVQYLNEADGTAVDGTEVDFRLPALGGTSPDATVGTTSSAVLLQALGDVTFVASSTPFVPANQPDGFLHVTLPDSPPSAGIEPKALQRLSVDGDTYYASAGNHVYAVSYAHAQACGDPSACVDWESPAFAAPVTSPPVIVNDHELAVTVSGVLVFLDPNTGAILWTDPTGDPRATQLIASDDGFVYVLLPNSAVVERFSTVGCGAPMCMAARMATSTTVAPGESLDVPMVAGGGLVYVAHGSNVDVLPACGALACVPITTLHVGAQVTGLSVAEGHVYVSTTNGLLTYGLS
jgi:outer membrane protein assembly factor BamB